MRLRYWQFPILFALLAVPSELHAVGVGWPEAVARLAGEREKAVTCVALLKGSGDHAEISRGQLAYAKAKSDIDAVIAGLVTALALDEEPETLPNLEAKLKSGTLALREFCKEVSDFFPSNQKGSKNVLVDITKAAIEPLIKALSEGVASLYENYRNDKVLVRKTIQTQLEATKWPTFAEVKTAQ